MVQARLRTTQAAALQQAVVLLKQSVEDVVFRFFPWGIQVCAIDQPNELSIIRFEIRKEAVVAEGGHYTMSRHPASHALRAGRPEDSRMRTKRSSLEFL